MNSRTIVAATVFGALVACGAHDAGGGGTQIELNGPYQAESAGPIAQITFIDSTHYSLMSNPCTGATATCLHTGTYSLNGAHDELSLKDDGTGAVTTYPFEAGEAAGLSTSISLEDLTVTGANGQPLTMGWPGVALLKNFSVGLIQFNAAQFQMHPGWERLTQHALNRQGINHCSTTLCFQQQSLDWLNAYWLARLSQIAYLNNDDARQALAAIGLKTDPDHLQFFDDTCTDTHGFYVTTADPPPAGSAAAPADTLTDPWNTASPNVAVLAFRGTDETSMLNIRTDLNAWPNHNGSSLGNVHEGFYSALTSVWSGTDKSCIPAPEMKTFLAQHHNYSNSGVSPTRTGAELYITGHSLGAALATVALAKTVTDPCDGLDPDCAQPYVPVSGLYTFGSPRVGNTAFAASLANAVTDRTPLFRFVHDVPDLGYDLVTTVPPLGLYRHLTTETNEADFEVFVQDGASQAPNGEAPGGNPKAVSVSSMTNVKAVHDIGHYAIAVQQIGGLSTLIH